MSVEPILGVLPDGWSYTTLGEACRWGGGDVQTGPFGSQLHASDYVEEGIPSIMPANIGENRIVEDGIARITEEDAQRLDRYRVRPGDIVYSRRGDVELRALVRPHEDGWLCGTGCLRVRVGANGHNPVFTSYYLGHPKVRQWIVRHARGATMANLNTTILSNLPFVEVPRDIQKSIAKVLGDLDDKIDLLREMNRTLQDIARAVFRAWFVDFDPVRAKIAGATSFRGMPQELFDVLPNSFERSDIGEIPKGWSVDLLGNLVAVPITRGLTPKYVENGGVAVLNQKCVRNWEINSDLSRRHDDEAKPPRDKVVERYDILVNSTGVGTLGRVAQVYSLREATTFHSHLSLVRPDKMKIAPLVLGYDLTEREHEIERLGHGSTGQTELSRQKLVGLGVIVPPMDAQLAFSELISPLVERKAQNRLEIETLCSLRDTLLPKLISGELEAPSLEALGLKAVGDGG